MTSPCWRASPQAGTAAAVRISRWGHRPIVPAPRVVRDVVGGPVQVLFAGRGASLQRVGGRRGPGVHREQAGAGVRAQPFDAHLLDAAPDGVVGELALQLYQRGATVSLSALTASPGFIRRSITWDLLTWELASGGGGTKLTVKQGKASNPVVGFVATQPLVTLCRGEVFWYVGGNSSVRRSGEVLWYVTGCDVRQLLVLRDPEDSRVVDHMNFVSSATMLADLGFPASQATMWDNFSAVIMGTHRDAVVVVLTMTQDSITRYRPSHMAGIVWRVDPPDDWESGAPTQWRVAPLLTDTVEELTGLRFADHADAMVAVCFVLGMRELLCCGVEGRDSDREPQRFMLGLNLETIHHHPTRHVWKLVHDEQGLMHMEDDGSGMALKVAKKKGR